MVKPQPRLRDTLTRAIAGQLTDHGVRLSSDSGNNPTLPRNIETNEQYQVPDFIVVKSGRTYGEDIIIRDAEVQFSPVLQRFC
jgi:hypothetical protein